MTSTRAQQVAEILWELKRADKVASYSAVAARAEFSAGTNGRAMETCLRAVRKGWPHLQWWRAIRDNGQLEKDSEQVVKLVECGYEIDVSTDDPDAVVVKEIDAHFMNWDLPEEPTDSSTQAPQEEAAKDGQ